jgi:hypothetical protein
LKIKTWVKVALSKPLKRLTKSQVSCTETPANMRKDGFSGIFAFIGVDWARAKNK